MGITRFLFLLIIGTAIFLFIEKDRVVASKNKEEKPTVTFFNSTMYEITNENVNQVVISKEAYLYKKREELYNATLISKANKKTYDTNTVSGNKIVKKGDNIYLTGAVNLILSDKTDIKTEQLQYNTKTKIATNKVNFVAKRDTDTFYGNTLFLDTINEKIEAKDTRFRMKVINK